MKLYSCCHTFRAAIPPGAKHKLSGCCNPRRTVREYPDPVDACRMADVNGIGDLDKTDPVIALDEKHSLGLVGINLFQPGEQVLPRNQLPVDAESRRALSVPRDLQNHRVLRSHMRRRGLRRRSQLPLRSYGHDHHENNQQDQQNIDHRRDIDFRMHLPQAGLVHGHRAHSLPGRGLPHTASAAYCPAMILGVMMPMWSTFAALAMSITPAMAEKFTSSSPLTNMTRSARLE